MPARLPLKTNRTSQRIGAKPRIPRVEKRYSGAKIPLIVSAETLRAAGITVPLREISLRGSSSSVLVGALNPEDLRQLLARTPAAAVRG